MTTTGAEIGKLFCFGHGYTAGALAARLATTQPSASIIGTRRLVNFETPSPVPMLAFDGQTPSEAVRRALADVTHILLSVPPGPDGDPVLGCHGSDLAAFGSVKWIGYLSTVGVYGDCGGAWVDETSEVRPRSERGRRRADAEAAWRAFGRAHGKRVEIFRLPGIYGPGRSAIDGVRAGSARRIIKAGQVFNRIHVDDLAAGLERAMTLAAAGRDVGFDTFNVVDDEPAPPQDVVAFAASLLGMTAPPEIAFEGAVLSPMARSFYSENKRVRSIRLKSALQLTLAYPTYREGLAAIAAACNSSRT